MRPDSEDSVSHQEVIENGTVTEKHSKDGNDQAHGFVVEEHALPPGYFYSPFFLGTLTATGLGLCSAVGGFGLAAPNLALINSEIGPSKSTNWISLVYTLTLAIGLLLVGRLSDLFGRRVS